MKSLLSSRVPDLQLDLLASQFNGLDFEVNADGADEGCVEGIITEPEQDAGFAHSRVTDQEELEQKIIALLSHDLFFMQTINKECVLSLK